MLLNKAEKSSDSDCISLKKVKEELLNCCLQKRTRCDDKDRRHEEGK